MIIDTPDTDFFDNCGASADGYDDHTIYCYGNGPVLDRFTIDERNKSITEAWACPILRAKQSAASKVNRPFNSTEHRNRQSVSLKAAYEDPARRQVMGARKKAYWDKWRAERLATASVEVSK